MQPAYTQVHYCFAVAVQHPRPVENKPESTLDARALPPPRPPSCIAEMPFGKKRSRKEQDDGSVCIYLWPPIIKIDALQLFIHISIGLMVSSRPT
jgi:hypothetical protein